MKKILLFAVTMMAMVSSCSNNAAKNDNNVNSDTLATDTVQGSAVMPTIEALMGDWKIAVIKDEKIQPLDSANFFMSFSDTNMGAKAGCNAIGGVINRNARSVDYLAFDNLLSTKMLCEDNKEDMFIECLNAVRKFSFVGDSLVLSNEDDVPVIKCVK